MKLSVVEWAVLALTGLFLTFTVGYFAGTQQAGTVTAAGTVTVQTETTPVSSETTEEAETETSEEVEPVVATQTAEPEPAESEEPDTVLVNINTADAAALEALPGIGEELAARIVAYREENGPFQFAEDITNVYGIGDGKYASIADYITVGE
jgi:competence protein ComEA